MFLPWERSLYLFLSVHLSMLIEIVEVAVVVLVVAIVVGVVGVVVGVVVIVAVAEIATVIAISITQSPTKPRPSSPHRKAINSEVEIQCENGERRVLRSTCDWNEGAINGDHLWCPTSASGDFCYVGEDYCCVSTWQSYLVYLKLHRLSFSLLTVILNRHILSSSTLWLTTHEHVTKPLTSITSLQFLASHHNNSLEILTLIRFQHNSGMIQAWFRHQILHYT